MARSRLAEWEPVRGLVPRRIDLPLHPPPMLGLSGLNRSNPGRRRSESGNWDRTPWERADPPWWRQFPFRPDLFRPRRLARAALDFLLPPHCVTCATPVDAPGLQCGPCFGALTPIAGPCCDCCGAPFELPWHAMEGGLCQRCLDTAPPFHRARAALTYDKASRRLVLPFKHGDRTEYASILARKMGIAGTALLRDADVLIPVPLHRRRLFMRRYNQAALLAQALGRMTGRPVLLDGLIRLHATESLGRKSAVERREEVAGAFAPRPARENALAGRRVLLIDDVMTSGATASACAEALLEAGAGSVDVLVAVRVPDPRLKPRRRFRRWKPPVEPDA